MYSQQVQYKLAVTVHRCLRYPTPKYFANCCVPVSEVSGRQHLRSASRRKLNIPRFRHSTFGTCWLFQSPHSDGLELTAWFVARSSRRVWNSFWRDLEDASLCWTLETWAHYKCHRFTESRYTNQHLLTTALF